MIGLAVFGTFSAVSLCVTFGLWVSGRIANPMLAAFVGSTLCIGAPSALIVQILFWVVGP